MVALPPSLQSQTTPDVRQDVAQKGSGQKWFKSLLLAMVAFSSVVGSWVHTAPQVHASESSFESAFDDCSDGDSEVTWPQIKTCLQGVAMEAKYQPVWTTVIRPKLFLFFDNHALSGSGIDDAILHKSFIYGDTFPSSTAMDSQIGTMLSYQNSGRDKLLEIGALFDKALADGDEEPSRSDVLCQLYEVPGYMLYGQESDSWRFVDSSPLFCDRENATNDHFLVRGLSAAVVYIVADIISSENFSLVTESPRTSGLLNDIKAMMGLLKSYMGSDENLATPIHEANLSTTPGSTPRIPHKDLKAFYSAQFTGRTPVVGSDGEIEILMEYCQGDGINSSAVRGSAAGYITAVKDCYDHALTDSTRTMSERSKEFVRKILVKATEAYSTKVASFPGEWDRRKAKEFMQSQDYVQLGEGYDPLASRRSEYSMDDYLQETVNDGYTDSASWVHDESDNNEITVSSNGPLGYISNLDDSVYPAVAWHAFAINAELIKEENYTIFLDRPLAPLPASSTTATPVPTATSTAAAGSTAEQNRQLFLSDIHAVRRVQVQSNRNVLMQMNDYMTRSFNANKPLMLFAWTWFANHDHDPNYPSAIEHSTGDLSLLTENKPGSGPIDRYFSDPYLARITNACSPNLVLDRISQSDLEPWKKCLEHEQEYVDKSDTNKVHKPHNTATDNFTMTLGSNLEPFKMRRSQPVVEAMQSMIQTIQSCIDRRATCLSLNDRDVGDQGTRQSGNAPGTADAGDSMLSAILSIINLILGLVIKFLLWLTALVMSFFQSVLSYAGFTTSDFVVKMWKAVRDFVNLFFILALLGIAVANIVQYEINNYAVKTILPKLIVVVIAVNFSRLIVGVGIDAGNVMEAGIYQIAGMGPHGGGTQAPCSTNTTQVGTLDVAIPQDIKDGSILCRLARGLRFQELQNYRETGRANLPTLTSLFLINVAILLILIMMLFGFLALSITFTIRIIVLWALAITSPLFVISKLSPMGQSVASEWQSKFIKYAFMQVKVAFFLTLAVLASEAVGSQIFSSLANTSPAVGGGSLSPVGFNSLADYLQLVFVIAMIYAAAFTAAKGDYANGLVDSIAKHGQNPLTSLRTGAKYAGRGLGLINTGAGLLGNRLQDAKGQGFFGKSSRLLGSIIAAPTNYTTGVKAVVADLKQSATERKERFGAVSGARLAIGQDMRDRFQAKVADNEVKIINQIAADAKLRFDPKAILGKAQDALGRNDLRSYRGYITAYAQSGGDLDEVYGGRTIRDQLHDTEMRRNTNVKDLSERRNLADKVIRDLEQTMTSEAGNRFQSGKTFAAKTKNKTEIQRELDRAIERGDKSYALGIVTAGFSGRLQNGGADGLQAWLRMRRGDAGIQITENDRRKISKDLSKDEIEASAVMLNDWENKEGNGERQHLQRVYEAAKQLGALTMSEANFEDIKGEEARKEADRVVSMLSALNKITVDGRTRYLSEVSKGREALARVAQSQLAAFGEIKPSGDDGNIGTMVQQIDASSMALASSMTESGKFRDSSVAKMVREAIQGYIQNAALIGNARGDTNEQEAAAFNAEKLTNYLNTLAGTITTTAQSNQITQQLKIIEENIKNASYNTPQEKTSVQQVFNSFKTNLDNQLRAKTLTNNPTNAGTTTRRAGSSEDEATPAG